VNYYRSQWNKVNIGEDYEIWSICPSLCLFVCVHHVSYTTGRNGGALM